MTITNIASWKNGNASIQLSSDGTRVIEFDDRLKLDYPLNIDIRVSTQCSFGYNPKTNSSVCDFCHESARVDGSECDYEELKNILKDLPGGIELAIGSNKMTSKLVDFLIWAESRNFICNVTVNQGHLKRDIVRIIQAIQNGLIKGLGISYRKGMEDIPKILLDYNNTVIHVINGIDDFADVAALSEQGVKKILVLGEKNFGFNLNRVNTESTSHVTWKQKVRSLFDKFEVVSFDNLGLEQLKVDRFFQQKEWDTLYQGEHSMYINATDKYFAPNSRSSDITYWHSDIKSYFKELENES